MLLGPQGSGKGTQGKRVASEYGLAYIATGDMLREAMAAGTPLGQRVKPIYDAGKLVPDDLMVGLIRERLSAADADSGFVLDGFPRNIAQADALEQMLDDIGRRLDVVLELQLDDDSSIGRLLKRAQLEERTDDTPETIRRRLAVYHEQTEPLVEYYRAKDVLVPIHGDGTIDEVYAEIQDALEGLAAR